jgi:phosphoribosylformylglycinamidine cyclo-ligase
VPLAGHYAGLIRIGHETIAITTDTVGTKSIVAEALGRWEEIGVDAVAVNVNDLASVGARPAGLVDVISCRRADPEVFAGIGRGLDRGLRAARCSLLGGETAIVPELVHGIDVGGTAIGFFPAGRRPVTGRRIRPGDRLIGLASTGLHMNGLTLARRVVDASLGGLGRRRPGSRRPIGLELIAASRIYVAASEALADRSFTTGFAHISGGGVRNLTRLHAGVRFRLDEWPTPPGLCQWLGAAGPIAPVELYQTFNMGIGFVVVVRPSALEEALGRLRDAGYPDARPIGRVTHGRGVALPGIGLEYDGYA